MLLLLGRVGALTARCFADQQQPRADVHIAPGVGKRDWLFQSECSALRDAVLSRIQSVGGAACCAAAAAAAEPVAMMRRRLQHNRRAHDVRCLQINSNSVLTSVSFPALAGVGGDFQVSVLSVHDAVLACVRRNRFGRAVCGAVASDGAVTVSEVLTVCAVCRSSSTTRYRQCCFRCLSAWTEVS